MPLYKNFIIEFCVYPRADFKGMQTIVQKFIKSRQQQSSRFYTEPSASKPKGISTCEFYLNLPSTKSHEISVSWLALSNLIAFVATIHTAKWHVFANSWQFWRLILQCLHTLQNTSAAFNIPVVVKPKFISNKNYPRINQANV